MSSSRSTTETVIAEAPSPQSGDERLRAVLVVVQGEQIGRRYRLEQSRLVMGRDARRADLVIEDASVSRRHAMLQVEAETGRCGVIDLGSRNGTFVNGDQVDSISLEDGDKILLGETVLKLMFEDAIEEDYHSRLDELMNVDSLTGLYVRRWFDAEYPRAFARARSEDQKFCVLMIDMDGLKQINDQHGYQLGSWCIEETGKMLLAALGPDNIGARFGGDEFVAYLPSSGADEARRVAEQMRGSVEAFDFRKDGVVVAPTLSIGVAVLGRGVKSPEELLRVADDALYRAKRAGRNTVAGPS